jgi:5,5'-dehydrodivanillate O-demethylase
VPREREPYVQGPIPTWHGPIKDAQGRWISSHVINQDIIAWVGQGTIADRAKENLGASDVGITMIRKRFFDELKALAQGHEPKGIIRNSNVARCIELPNMERKRCVEGITLKEFETIPVLKARLQGFRWQYGQPPEVRRAFEEAIGISPQGPA